MKRAFRSAFLALCGGGMAVSAQQLGTIPLKTLQVRGEFFDTVGEVAIQQNWSNDAAIPITSKYQFSLDSNAVITGYKLKIGEKVWTGVVKAKDVAKAEYVKAVESGTKASLFEKLSDSKYQVSIGPIAPSETAEIEFRYLTRASVMKDGSYRFVLPTNIAPLYYNPTTTNKVDVEYASATGSIHHVSHPDFSFDINITWNSGTAVREIGSPTNVIHTEILSANSVRVHCNTAPENGDFSLTVRSAEATGAYKCEKEDGTVILYVNKQIPDETAPSATVRRITFVVDRSGSMNGDKIKQAVAAIDTFLSYLTVDDAQTLLLNVVSFGFDHKAMFSHSVLATSENVGLIRQRLAHFSANFGGTELLLTLRAVVYSDSDYASFESKTEPQEAAFGTEHVIVLLTDGQVTGLQSILDMLVSVQSNIRIMSVGIGRDADRELVESVAEATNGVSRLLMDERDLTVAVADIMECINKQYYTNVRVVGHEEAASLNSKVLYPLHPVDMFLHLTTEQYQEVVRIGGITITASDPVRGGTKEWNLPLTGIVNSSSSLLGKLYANHMISVHLKALDREMNETRKSEMLCEIVKLSVEHGIMTRVTSFVVVSDDRVPEEVLSDVQEVSVPHHSNPHIGRRVFTMNGGIPSGGGAGSYRGAAVGHVWYAGGSTSSGAQSMKSLDLGNADGNGALLMPSVNDDQQFSAQAGVVVLSTGTVYSGNSGYLGTIWSADSRKGSRTSVPSTPAFTGNALYRGSRGGAVLESMGDGNSGYGGEVISPISGVGRGVYRYMRDGSGNYMLPPASSVASKNEQLPVEYVKPADDNGELLMSSVNDNSRTQAGLVVLSTGTVSSTGSSGYTATNWSPYGTKGGHISVPTSTVEPPVLSSDITETPQTRDKSATPSGLVFNAQVPGLLSDIPGLLILSSGTASRGNSLYTRYLSTTVNRHDKQKEAHKPRRKCNLSLSQKTFATFPGMPSWSKTFYTITLVASQLSDGSLEYSDDVHLLLTYVCEAYLLEDAEDVGVSPALYFSIAVLVVAEAETEPVGHGVTETEPRVIKTKLREYVTSQATDEQIGKVAEIVNNKLFRTPRSPPRN